MHRITPVALLALFLFGCPDTETRFDFDGDGVEDSADCAPEDPDNFPGNTDPYDDGVDTNCDGYDGIDGDGDGYPSNVEETAAWHDCNDANDHVHPGAEDTIGDGTDNNCDGVDGVDADGDGFAAGDGVALDCDDSDPESYPGADEEIDGRDNDCDGTADEGTDAADDDGDGYCEGYDLDGDGLDDCAADATPGDCDDAALGVHPGAEEMPDGVDDDCDGLIDEGTDVFDDDGDGLSEDEGDCDDGDAAVHPGAPELPNCSDDDCDGAEDEGTDSVDTDGDGYCVGVDLGAGLQCCAEAWIGDCDDDDPDLDPADLDGDGFSTCDGDCDDDDPDISPGAMEICNLLDDDCDGMLGNDEADEDGDSDPFCTDCNDNDGTLTTLDLDGDTWSTCDGDCDDTQAWVNPMVTDVVGDGYDQNCDGIDGTDADGDGEASEASGGIDCDDDDPAANHADNDLDGVSGCDGDCDDDDPLTFPGAAEQCDLLDNDCNGDVDDGVWEDGDGDGWFACQGDCDDQEIDVFPGAPELCDGLDNDCDDSLSAGEVDDDGDGWSPCDGDCDDGDIYTNPHAAELCNGLDDDCDGDVDDGCLDCDWWVPGDFATIDDAISGAGTGDVVCVEPGLYLEQIVIDDDRVIAGLAGSRLTIIDGDQAGTVVEINGAAGPGTLLTGLGITGGLGPTYGGGVYVNGTSPTLRKLTLTGNHADWGGGVGVYDPSEAVLEDLVFEDNSSGQFGGGLYVRGNANPSDVTLRRARFTRNDGGGYMGGGGMGVYGNSCSVHIEQVLFDRNTAAGGAALLVYSAEVTGSTVRFQANESTSDSAVFNYDGSLTLDSVTFVANTGHGALMTEYGLTSLSNATFVANRSSSVGGAIYHNSTDALELVDVDLAYNEAPNGGGGLWLLYHDNLEASHCNAWANVPDDYSGVTDPVGMDGNVAVEPFYLDSSHPNPVHWDLHLSAGSPLVNAGDATLADLDGSISDIGAYGGPDAGTWDLDLDGWNEWWQPGGYDFAVYPVAGWDCDDRDAGVYPGHGC